MNWGVVSPGGIVSIAPKGEAQARAWAEYDHPGVTFLSEDLTHRDGANWEKVAA